ncbi:hypothetical protein NPIL_42471 [Nephila pilipes]|uniref:Uncharacterized protein n=1 Tax=Nephila pilipes TaxID=299642 RepID=A0A8X6TS65_NEPPI|nr:hypothetical protein NPIL_42471 [Nephila pilipes]
MTSTKTLKQSKVSKTPSIFNDSFQTQTISRPVQFERILVLYKRFHFPIAITQITITTPEGTIKKAAADVHIEMATTSGRGVTARPGIFRPWHTCLYIIIKKNG